MAVGRRRRRRRNYRGLCLLWALLLVGKGALGTPGQAQGALRAPGPAIGPVGEGRPPPHGEGRRRRLLRALWTKNEEEGRGWGSHPLPPLSSFGAPEGGGSRWVAYFHEEAVAAVLRRDADGAVLDCIVQEVIEAWEQREARKYLGQAMPLLPLPLPSMVHLIALCGSVSRPPQTTAPLRTAWWWLGPSSSSSSSALKGILPGTLWCGRRDAASSYGQLGERVALDACCRDHDHCPQKVLPLRTRYGVSNFGLATRSHCTCDLEFLRCLKAIGDEASEAVGKLYFNLLQVRCIQPGSPGEPPRMAF